MKTDELFPNGKTPLFYLGANADEALCFMETYEQRVAEVFVLDSTEEE